MGVPRTRAASRANRSNTASGGVSSRFVWRTAASRPGSASTLVRLELISRDPPSAVAAQCHKQSRRSAITGHSPLHAGPPRMLRSNARAPNPGGSGRRAGLSQRRSRLPWCPQRRGPARKGANMGQPVVHFEIIGKDAGKLQSYYSDLFGWRIDANNPMNYGVVPREGNTNADGIGIGGGVGVGPEGYQGHVTFYVEVPDVEASLAKAERLGGKRLMGPDKVSEELEVGQFADPEGHVIGVIRSAT